MINITTRPLTVDEQAMLNERNPGLYKKIETNLLLLLVVAIFLVIPIVMFEDYIKTHSIAPELFNIWGMLAIICTALYCRRVFFPIKPLLNNKILAEVIHVKTTRAIMREDPEDFGIAYYIEVVDAGLRKVLYLWGQYFYELDEETFPNTEFEFVRLKGSDEFISFQILGEHFKEEKVLPAFGDEIWKNGKYPTNGTLLNVRIDDVE